MSSRCRSLLLVLLPALALAAPAAADDENSWVGMTILTKIGDVKFRRMDDDGKIVFESKLTVIVYKVLREEGRWVRVRDRGQEGWVAKADVVRLEDAVGYFTDLIGANSRDASAYGYRALAWSLKGELDIAIKDYDEAIRLDPKAAAWWNNRGGVWDDKKEYDKAIKDYDEAIRLDPKDASAFHNRGGVWMAKKEYDKAIGDFDEAIRLDPKLANAFNRRGVAWKEKKDHDRAIKDYDEAIRLDPKDAILFNNRGFSWRAKKEYDKAIKDFSEAIRLDPKYAYAFGNRARVLVKKKQYDQAVTGFEEAIKLAPMDWLHLYYALFRATCPEAKYRDGKKAVELAKKAIELAGKDAGCWYLDALAAAYAEAGDFEKAIAEQEKALADKSLDKEDRAKMEKRLALYHEKKPYRDED